MTASLRRPRDPISLRVLLVGNADVPRGSRSGDNGGAAVRPASIRGRRAKEEQMIADQVTKLLIGQVATELTAHQIYMGISAYFTRESLNGWAKHFRD